jgi:hypothetical protein
VQGVRPGSLLGNAVALGNGRLRHDADLGEDEPAGARELFGELLVDGQYGFARLVGGIVDWSTNISDAGLRPQMRALTVDDDDARRGEKRAQLRGRRDFHGLGHGCWGRTRE